MRQLFWELEMNRMGGKDTVFGAAWRRGSGGFAGTPERHQIQSAAVVEASLRAAVEPRGEAVGLRQEEGPDWGSGPFFAFFRRGALDSLLGSHWGHFSHNFILVLYCIALYPLLIKAVAGFCRRNAGRNEENR